MHEDLLPLERLSVADRATNRLREHVLSGAIEAGTRLTELSLAERLGIGRASVRAALVQLSFEGLVVKTPYTGWHIAELSSRSVWETWTLRASLESLAARIIAENLDGPTREAITASHRAFHEVCLNGQVDGISARDFEFHKLTVELSGHQRLREQYRLVENQVRLFIITSNAHAAVTGEEAFAQHEALMAALFSGDPEVAAREAWQHSHSAGIRLSRWIERRAVDATERDETSR
ncbi:GntR family transcriptional regulator [Leucobacter sp. wl10]|uniref:GntR family transcriptional regulator n=1 Tax=Leucobacter sp. wl10 TaxID=2304677 RepID=UPI000E5BE430|nr:GntR family transcriptional regulator [Leucobacter sp. wl10]RGE22029.1 GntR family transcriptional regulator [Leucobacter sp. wl10]